MTDDRLFTTDPNTVVQRGDDVSGGMRNEINNPMMQSGVLATYVNSEEMRSAMDAVVLENQQLKDQLKQALECLAQWKPRNAELEKIKCLNDQLTKMVHDTYRKSKIKVSSLEKKINELKQQNEALKKQIAILQRNQSADSSPDPPLQTPILNALKSHMRAVEEILRQELSTGKQEYKDKDILEKLMGHVKKAEEILATPDVEVFQVTEQSSGRHDGERQGMESPSDRKSPAMSPLSPTGQQEYNRSMQNVLSQLEDLRRQVNETTSALNKERQRSEGLEIKLDKAKSEITSLKGAQESHVAAAMEKQRKEDDVKYQHEIQGLMAKVDELTLLAAEKHQQHAFEEEPRYHSASNELKQQVTSLVAELEHREKSLTEAKGYQQQLHQQLQQQKQVSDTLQRKVTMYHEELAKARREAQSYIDTVHGELKRKETLYQSERQKALHEKLQHEKCKEDLLATRTSLNKFAKEKSQYQEKEDRHLAEILSAEEAIEAKEIEKQRYEQQAAKFKKELEIWKTQTEVCQKDFQEERKAREEMHTEKMNLQVKIDELERDNKKLEEELAIAHRHQLRGGMAPHYRQYGAYDRAGGADFFGPQRRHYDVPYDDEAVAMEHMTSLQNQHLPNPDVRPPQQATSQNWCPKCQQTFPDFDTLDIHMAECIP